MHRECEIKFIELQVAGLMLGVVLDCLQSMGDGAETVLCPRLPP